MGILKDPREIPNKQKRSEQLLKLKKAKESVKRDERLRRRRAEDKNPKLREERRARNVPATIDSKRVWDEVDNDGDFDLGASVDLTAIKRRRVEDERATSLSTTAAPAPVAVESADAEHADSDNDSMLDADEDQDEAASDDEVEDDGRSEQDGDQKGQRQSSPAPSTATDMTLTPENLQSRFPTLFAQLEHPPKVLITTSFDSKLRVEAATLTSLFPNSHFVPRNTHYRGNKYSIREIAKFASNRQYTTVVILNQDLKKPSGLDIVHLPHGPMFHFSISNWVPGSRLPGHGNPTGHDPELILNGFKTPLGLLTAHLFRTLFPPQPELAGRTVVTLHNQRDYIFVRRHRYVFRDKRATEKSVQGGDGKAVKGVEDIRTGLQELGPRFTLKLRRIDRGIQRSSGQEWQWSGKTDKIRTKFSL